MKTNLILLAIVVCSINVIYASTQDNKCLASAGYTWCAYENKCVRPWEIAKEKGLENTPENIGFYCNLKRINDSKTSTSEAKKPAGGESGDAHGCHLSAGYSWCAKEGKCVRPWELAKEKQLDSSPKAFASYCNQANVPGTPLLKSNHAHVGGEKDNNGCLSAAGYSWCAKEGKCIRPWELAKEKGIDISPESVHTYCATCISSAGYSWCEKEQKCVRPWELASLRNIENTPESFKSYCSGSSTPVAKIGGDSDSHGCVSGAGYVWCGAEGKCVRPWELARDRGFQNSATNLQQYCAGLAVVTSLPVPQPSPAAALRRSRIGGSSDSHGCVSGAGYSWCEKEQKCVRPWELASEKNIQNSADAFSAYCSGSDADAPVGGSTDSHGCIAGAGYSWCEKEGKCVRPWELASEKNIENSADAFSAYCSGSDADAPVGGSTDSHGCIAGAGYSWCQNEGKCVRPWELASEKNIENSADAFKSYCSN